MFVGHLYPDKFVFAQHHPTDTLEHVIVIDSAKQTIDGKTKFISHFSTQRIDKQFKSLYELQSLDKLLQNNSSVFIKNYGINNLSTLSIRGTSAAQSQVMWQGIPLNDVISGYSDLSLLNSGLFDQVSVQYGGHSTLYGNGTIGGAISLENVPKQKDFYHIRLSGGSYDTWSGLGIAEKKTNAGLFTIRATMSKAENRIPLQGWNTEHEYLEHAYAQQMGLIFGYHHSVKLFSRKEPTKIQFNTWIQKDYREIPPAFFEKHSAKTQFILAWRNMLKLQQSIGKAHLLDIRYSYQDLRYRYEDSLSFQNNDYRTQIHFAEVGWTRAKPLNTGVFHHHYYVFVPITVNHLEQLYFAETATQMRSGLSGIYRLALKEDLISLQLGLRKEFQNDVHIPITYQLQLAGQTVSYETKSLSIKAPVYVSYQTAFRTPTLNELYYFPGGNRHLQPEASQNVEAGAKLEFANDLNPSTWKVLLQTAYFNRHISNWIYWLGNTIWTPHNIAEVYSRGWDWKLDIRWNSRMWRIQNQTEYSYTIATTQSTNLPGSNSLGKQIPYTPRYIAQNNFVIYYRYFGLVIGTVYNGYRFTNLDESSYLPPYWMCNTHLIGNVPLTRDRLLQVQVQCMNLTNAKVESVPGRIMSPRQWILSVSITL